MAPESADTGSDVGIPVLSTAQPSGNGCPDRRCSLMSPRAIALVAKSNAKGAPLGLGQPNAMGLVQRRASRPRQAQPRCVQVLPLRRQSLIGQCFNLRPQCRKLVAAGNHQSCYAIASRLANEDRQPHGIQVESPHLLTHCRLSIRITCLPPISSYPQIATNADFQNRAPPWGQ